MRALPWAIRTQVRRYEIPSDLKWHKHPSRVIDKPKTEQQPRKRSEAPWRKYEQLRNTGQVADLSLIQLVLKNCRSRLEVARIHDDLKRTNTVREISVANTLIDMYGNFGSIEDARGVFDSMAKRDVISWNSMMKGYIISGDAGTALDLFSRLQDDRLLPNSRTYIAALKACASLANKEEWQQVNGRLLKVEALEKGAAIHAQLARYHYESEMFVASALVDMYGRCGNFEESKRVFDKMLLRDVVCWTSLIMGYAISGKEGQALELLNQMKEEGLRPDARTYVAALTACTNLAAKEQWEKVNGKLVKAHTLARGEAIHSQIKKAAINVDMKLESALVGFYAKCGSLEDARFIFSNMCRSDAVPWTSMIAGYSECGEAGQAVEIFFRMRDERVVPGAQTFVAALNACSRLAGAGEGRKVEHEAVRMLALEKGAAIHSQLADTQHASNLIVANALVDMYSKCGSMANARRVFDSMPRRNIISWNSIILGYAQGQDAETALELLSLMQREGMKPDARTYAAGLKACSSLVALEIGRKLHDEIRNAGLESDPMLGSSLVDFYGKCGSMVDAQQVFDSLRSNRDVVTWNALIAGYGNVGNSEQVFQLFDRMQGEQNVKVDGVTFLSVLTACSHAGLVDKGKRYFAAMSRKYKLSPGTEHYTCMVDLLARANHMDEAVSMVQRMPVKAKFMAWLTVLGACRKWKNVEVGKLAFDNILRVGGKHLASPYVLMGNIYASAGMWDERAKVQAMRRSVENREDVEQSLWVDDARVVHRFQAGSEGNYPQRTEILAKLKIMDVGMNEETEACAHSERWAVGCAIVNMAARTAIRISKSGGVICEECHRVMALISKLERRTVICRDASQFHVFGEGRCSCLDQSKTG